MLPARRKADQPVPVKCRRCRLEFLSESAAYMPKSSLQDIMCINCIQQQEPAACVRRAVPAKVDNTNNQHWRSAGWRVSSLPRVAPLASESGRKEPRQLEGGKKRVRFRIEERIFVPGRGEYPGLGSSTFQDSRTHVTVTRIVPQFQKVKDITC